MSIFLSQWLPTDHGGRGADLPADPCQRPTCCPRVGPWAVFAGRRRSPRDYASSPPVRWSRVRLGTAPNSASVRSRDWAVDSCTASIGQNSILTPDMVCPDIDGAGSSTVFTPESAVPFGPAVLECAESNTTDPTQAGRRKVRGCARTRAPNRCRPRSDTDTERKLRVLERRSVRAW